MQPTVLQPVADPRPHADPLGAHARGQALPETPVAGRRREAVLHP